ncbi:MAG: GcvT family protein [Verrucomicrobia bacterium]|jgi:glycine cleavage system aminomethyltransferase T/glycine/D-amino acid oxidase-like deaminating enzyme|nr:GcvT family protein [Verrucomicrobiota bacterium]
METLSSIPTTAQVVVVGGGIVGCSVAYHLTKLGFTDVVLLEQKALAGGTTWHAAGMVGRLRTSNSLTKINQYSAELYAGLEAETGHSTGWQQVGSLVVASTKERMTQLYRTAAMAEYLGVQADIISATEAGEKWPLLKTDDLLGAVWLSGDGKVIPKETTLALAKGAQMRGAKICENVETLQILHRKGRVAGVETNQGSIEAEYVVLACGMWSRQLGLTCGVSIPLAPVEHHYVVSNPIEGAFDGLPCGRDPDATTYFRGEGNAVVLGAFQKYTKPWLKDPIPSNFSFELLEADWEKYREPLRAGEWRIPKLKEAGYEKFVNGPESFTPDNQFLLGETPELKGLFVSAGFNSAGIACAGGAGKYLAEWMSEGEPTMDLWAVDIRRFGKWANNRTFLRDRITEVLGLHYQMAWPNREFETGRNIRTTPIHDRLKAAGAAFGSKAGWERPNWFAIPSSKPEVEYSFGKQNWFESHAKEHLSTRKSVALFDQSSFAKLRLKGKDACAVMQHVCGNNMDVPVGKAVYTGMFNTHGGFESDFTAVRLAEDEYYIVTASTQSVHDANWISRNTPKGMQITLTDVTGGMGVLSVMGPESRDFLQPLTDADLSDEAFPFGISREISIGMSTVTALRLSYMGELGWELHVGMDHMAAVYDTLMSQSKNHSITLAGHYAINSLRLEKGFRAWGHELSPDDNPFEAGLGFAVNLKKEQGFLGQEALTKIKAEPLRKRMAIFTLTDPNATLWGGEIIYRKEQVVGYTTSGSFGHSVGAGIAMGYVRNKDGVDRKFVMEGEYALKVGDEMIPAKVHLKAPVSQP